MKNKIKLLIFIILFSFSIILPVNASQRKIKIYFFHGDGCPHCAEEEKYLDKITKKNKNIEIIDYEVWYNKDNQQFMEKVMKELEIDSSGVPLTIIGSTPTIGYNEVVGNKLDRIINYYSNNDYVDVVSKIKNDTYNEKIKDKFTEEEKKSDKASIIKIPLFGKVNLKKLSIPMAASLVGFVDGFNPCAMWVLLFLISMLLTMKDRKKMWILGITFIFTSGFVYMLIMLSWLHIIVNISTSILIRNIIACFSIVAAIINLKNYFQSEDSGCNVTDEKQRKKIINRIKKFTHEKSFALAILGIIGLAISVNLVELACSLGLPLVFTQLLAINNISGIKAFMYTLNYIFFFLIDDIIIFLIAMKTTTITAISTKYNKYSHLIGGIIMLIIGILLLFKPEWLMFQFK